jgi:hypothetical protein
MFPKQKLSLKGSISESHTVIQSNVITALKAHSENECKQSFQAWHVYKVRREVF